MIKNTILKALVGVGILASFSNLILSLLGLPFLIAILVLTRKERGVE